MHVTKMLICVLFFLIGGVMAHRTRAADAKDVSVLPMAMRLEVRDGAGFRVNPKTVILASGALRSEAEYLAQQLSPAMGFRLEVRDLGKSAAVTKQENWIVFLEAADLSDLGDEGYVLSVDEKRAMIRSAKPAGAFYACQTIRQLLPPEIESKQAVEGVEWVIPAVMIEDGPRFGWRGSLLDCARHFRTKEYVKKYIDLLAYHKMNRFHWHLTEDQGWRIEIKRYPKLTEFGSWRGEGEEKYGGFYTQEDVKEIVAYAESHHVMVIPEIEMPGHSQAALACYPELSCTGGPFEVGTRWGVYKDVYCAGNDEVFEFLQNVLTEVIELFPAPYIHIGGDECPKERWKECAKCQARIKSEGLEDENELQSYFVKRMENFLLAKNRRLIGWDEILEGGLSPHATVQSWRGMQGGIAAAREDHDVVMSPTSHCYLDYGYDRTPVEKSYSFEPVPPELTGEQAKHILGLEGNMWGEHTPTDERVDWQTFPRLCALAEVAWSPKEPRQFEEFRERLALHGERLDRMGVKYFRDPAIWNSVSRGQ
jgi:hexosaminidase